MFSGGGSGPPTPRIYTPERDNVYVVTLTLIMTLDLFELKINRLRHSVEVEDY